jgi:hypothetical protein
MSATDTRKANEETLRKAPKLIQGKLDKAMVETILPKAAEYFVQGFASLWQENYIPSLTGSTFTSFCVGVYRDSTLLATYSIMDLLNVKAPASNPTDVGSYGFADYDTGEYIGYENNPKVKPYNVPELQWQEHSEESGKNQALSFLTAHKPVTKGYTLVVCVGTDYSAWLQKMRGLDILTSVRMYAASNVTTAVVQYKNLNNGKL